MGMAVLLLIMFPLLLLVNTPLAGVSLVAAIVMLYRGKTAASPTRSRTTASIDDASI